MLCYAEAARIAKHVNTASYRAPHHLLICLLSGATPRPCSSSESPFMLLCLRSYNASSQRCK